MYLHQLERLLTPEKAKEFATKLQSAIKKHEESWVDEYWIVEEFRNTRIPGYYNISMIEASDGDMNVEQALLHSWQHSCDFVKRILAPEKEK